MKKRLEADLISIAHRILQLKNKSDINQLYLETQKLYEKLAVLRFVDEHFGEVKPTIGLAEMEAEVAQIFNTEEVVASNDKTPTDLEENEEINTKQTASLEVPTDQKNTETPVITEEEIIKPAFELDEIEEIAAADNNEISDKDSSEENSKPAFELDKVEETALGENEEISHENTTEENNETTFELNQSQPVDEIQPLEETTPIVEEVEAASSPEVQTEAVKKPEAVQISFEDILGGNFIDTQFVKASHFDNKPESNPVEVETAFNFQQEPHANEDQTFLQRQETKSITLNDKLAKGIVIGLNDRIAFVKHLFGGNNEDYNRVLNQLITLDTFQETKSFIDEMVKPDYNNWDGKEEYEQRFMEIIEKKFLSF